mmetsp:Transcript_4088/g.5015  ORF Transcript_4088/g.5015 Transcript_4088/m.5015 type:complete len:455 (-) Transcript_4088:732-2096(-)|eukprot:CAMPEP_0203714202 /NCGR_PEP_ID=MMETSP0091-20130426/70955_1 /ASSEMBLY_ACC=CAM_ASM_001089 /TAXON_ID=426623 /ORGANISM="Chaetoceros affinis, Strain CCMP159" /LENGTH=454 /DNA_ID=CAMNT_0050592251 /DNA_START=83 /DNA_END=1447 /DNA_ORIENTATION=+
MTEDNNITSVHDTLTATLSTSAAAAPPPAVAPTYNPNPNTAKNDFLTQEQLDEMLARRLQADYDNNYNPNHMRNDMSQNPMADQEMARRVEMEMKDQMYAIQLQAYEQSRQQQRALQAAQNNNGNGGGHHPRVVTGSSPHDARMLQAARQAQQRQSGCSAQRCFSALLMLVIVCGAAVLILFYGSSIWDRFSGGGDLPPFFQWEESDGTTEEFKSWKTRGRAGLTLTIVNAMTDDWYAYFDEAVADWNAAPALNLVVEMADDPDPSCTYIRGKLKACNGEYGMGGWSGLNEAWLDDRNFIVASTAKMNESYLKGKDDAEKLYVTCHELGHGYGLPHRDTNANNIDLGTCLDYTTKFKNNMHPDETDFVNLEKLYGTYDRRNKLRSLNSQSSKARGNSQRRDTKSSMSSSSLSSIDLQNQSYKEGRLLYKSDKKEIYEQDLADGGRKITTVLLAN